MSRIQLFQENEIKSFDLPPFIKKEEYSSYFFLDGINEIGLEFRKPETRLC